MLNITELLVMYSRRLWQGRVDRMNVNGMRTHLISCAGMDPERIRAASDRSIEITYDLHQSIAHDPRNAEFGKVAKLL